jgi:hypothetical protein
VLFISPYKNYRQLIHPGIPERHPVSADIIGWKIKPLAAGFGKLGDEQLVYNPLTQTMETVADIQTGVYDTEVAAANEGWTNEEREIVENSLTAAAEKTPLFLRKLNPVHVPAEAPWQTYDQTETAKVVELSVTLNLVPEALRYERENAKRESVLAGLEAKLDPLDESRAAPITKVDVHVEKPAARIAKGPRTTRGGIVVDTPGLEGLKEGPEPEPSVGGTVTV